MKLFIALDSAGMEFIGVYNNEYYLKHTFKVWLDRYYDNDDEEGNSYEECIQKLAYFKDGSDVCIYVVDLQENKVIKF